MRIGICDDDVIWRSQAQEFITTYGKEYSIPMEIVFLENGSQIEVQEELDVLFMDIELENESGIQVVSKINKIWKNCQIVYLTNYLQYAMDVYQTEHSYFMIKSEFERRLDEIFVKITRNMNRRRQKLIFRLVGGKSIVLTSEEMIYFERDQRKTNIWTTHGCYCVWDKLKDIEKILPKDDFVWCHNSYIVYLPAVAEMYPTEFIMENGTGIPISRSHCKKAKELFSKWALTQMS